MPSSFKVLRRKNSAHLHRLWRAILQIKLLIPKDSLVVDRLTANVDGGLSANGIAGFAVAQAA
jgi:hypothetical protein